MNKKRGKMKDKLLKRGIDRKVDERGEYILGKIYRRIFRTSDIILALVSATLYMASLYGNFYFSAKEVAIMLVAIAFINRLFLRFAVKKERVVE